MLLIRVFLLNIYAHARSLVNTNEFKAFPRDGGLLGNDE